MTHANQPTHYQESNALLHVCDDNDAKAREVINGMTRRELRLLRDAAARLARLCDDEQWNRDDTKETTE